VFSVQAGQLTELDNADGLAREEPSVTQEFRACLRIERDDVVQQRALVPFHLRSDVDASAESAKLQLQEIS
jgi:hypothetical protein